MISPFLLNQEKHLLTKYDAESIEEVLKKQKKLMHEENNEPNYTSMARSKN